MQLLMAPVHRTRPMHPERRIVTALYQRKARMKKDHPCSAIIFMVYFLDDAEPPSTPPPLAR